MSEQVTIIGGGLAGCEAAWQAAEGGLRVTLHEMRPQRPTAVPRDGLTIVCTGPLTSDALAADLQALTGAAQLSFFDAIAPTIEADSIAQEVVFRASRYGKGGADYLNCPLDKPTYEAFWEALVSAERFIPKHPDDTAYFEGCLPVEVIAERGFKALLFGPMKPVGLDDPRTGRWAYGIVQLRQENRSGTLYSLVGFQTQLRRPEQERVFRMIPGLEQAEFARYGQVHRNTFLNAPAILNPTLQLRTRPDLLLAGQLIGVEGYTESTAAGLVAGLNAVRLARGDEPVVPPETTMIGALLRYVGDPWLESFQPMNANFGLLPHLPVKGKQARKEAYAARALEAMRNWAATVGRS